MTQRRTSQVEMLFSPRVISLVILLSLLAVLAMFFQSDAFYVHSIEVGGLDYLSAGEVFSLSGVASMHIFWIDPDGVRDRIMESSSVADVDVLVGWPPHLLQVEIQEREPALIWEPRRGAYLDRCAGPGDATANGY